MIKFTKMHGLGNDYVYIDAINQKIQNELKLAQFVSNRHFGIGSDGLILICESKVADFKMRMFNSDGSEAEMCGNGIRCVGKFVYDKGFTSKTTVTIETLAGIKTLKLNIKDKKVETVRVDMGEPILEADKIPVISKEEPVKLNETEENSCKHNCICPPGTKRKCTIRNQVPGSISFVPSVAGLIIAGEVVKAILND